jgi:hypothetical protein
LAAVVDETRKLQQKPGEVSLFSLAISLENFCQVVDQLAVHSQKFNALTRMNELISVKSTEAAHRKTLLHFPPDVTADDLLSLCSMLLT